MHQAVPELVNYIATNNNVVLADLYWFSFKDIGLYRFHDFDAAGALSILSTYFPGSPLNYNSANPQFIPFEQGPRFARSKVSTKIGIEPTDLQIEIYPGPSLLGNQTWQQAVMAEWFDGCIVELDRLFIPVGGDGTQAAGSFSYLSAIVWFYGLVSEIESGRSSIRVTAKSLINLLQQTTMPRRLFQTGCTHVFGDAMCGYDRTNGISANQQGGHPGAFTAVAQPGSVPTIIIINSGVSGPYQQGTIIGISGLNAGTQRTISSYDVNGNFAVPSKAFPQLVNVGDEFSLLPGCLHTKDACLAFGNFIRYGGFPSIPAPETAV